MADVCLSDGRTDERPWENALRAEAMAAHCLRQQLGNPLVDGRTLLSENCRVHLFLHRAGEGKKGGQRRHPSPSFLPTAAATVNFLSLIYLSCVLTQ
jgi:hypothetical protein